MLQQSLHGCATAVRPSATHGMPSRSPIFSTLRNAPRSLRVRNLQVQCSSDGAYSQISTVHRLLKASGGTILVPGCYDALSAQVMARAGHKAAFVSGYAVSATQLGQPDLGLLTPPEMAHQVALITAAAPSLAVFADADTGGGNVLNVQRTIRQLVAAGAKGCFIEDQEWPKRPGQLRNKNVIPLEEFAGKVAAAREAIGDSDFFLVARTDARGSSAKYGLEEAIKRANLFIEAGANASFIEGPRTVEELREIGKQTIGLRVCNMMEGNVTPMCTPDELQEMGFNIIIHPVSGLYAATRALINTYELLATKGTTRDDLEKLVDFTEFSQIISLEEKLATEELLTHRENKITVRVRAPGRPVS